MRLYVPTFVPTCEWCGTPVKLGPRGGRPFRCAQCEQERRDERSLHRRAVKVRPIRLCRRCSNPATSQRHHYCDECRARIKALSANNSRRSASGGRRDTRTRQERGYDAKHDRRRRRWAARVASGGVQCGRCGRPILSNEPWDLSHPGDDKSIEPVPWCRSCNRSYAASVTGPRRRAERQAR